MNLLREKLRARGHHLLRCSEAPDTSGINRAAEANAKVAQEALDWYKQQYAESAPQRQAATDLAMEQAGLQNDLSKQQLQTSQQQQQRYNTTFAPLEDKIAADAMNYDTPAREEQAAQAASADAQQQVSLQRAATQRDLARVGALPTSGRAQAIDAGMDLGAAKLRAGAANQARQQVQTLGAAKMMDAAGLGRGVVSNQGTAAGLALSAGNSAVGNGTQPVNIAGAGASLMGQGFQTAIQGNNAAGSLYGQAANIQNQANSSSDGLFGALGQIGGAALFKYSDKRMKTARKNVKGEVALASARKMPVQTYRYKKGSPADDGGRQHVGPMAQDVHAAMGEAGAPGGKVIDIGNMSGLTLAAVRELDRKVTRLERAKKRA